MSSTGVSGEVLQIAEETLRGNWIEGERDGVRYGYSRPSPGHYPWQWYWDSCFHAIVWRRFDPARAESELAQPAGRRRRRRLHRPHDLLARPRRLAAPLDLQRHLEERAPTPRRSSRRCSPGPGGSRSATRPTSRGSLRTTAGCEANRDLDGDGLLWIVQPDESGLDASPKFDPVWGLRAHAPTAVPLADRAATGGSAGTRAGSASAAARCSARWSRTCSGASPGMAAGRALDHAGAGRAALGRARAGSSSTSRGQLAQADRPGRATAGSTSTWSALAPLALPDLPEEIGRRLVEEHLLDPRSYWLPFPPHLRRRPRSPASSRAVDGARCAALLARPDLDQLGLAGLDRPARLGYEAEAMRDGEAARAARSAEQRLREFYEPYAGEGLGREGVRLVLADRRAGGPGPVRVFFLSGLARRRLDRITLGSRSGDSRRQHSDGRVP